MRSGSTAEITEIIQNQLIANNCKTEAKIEVWVDGGWEFLTDLDEEAGIDWTESGKIEKHATIALTPLAGTVSFRVLNIDGKYSIGSGTNYEGWFGLDTKVRLQAGYWIPDGLSETSESINLNSISGPFVKSFFHRTAHSGSTVILDQTVLDLSHFSDLFDPLYDSGTYASVSDIDYATGTDENLTSPDDGWNTASNLVLFGNDGGGGFAYTRLEFDNGNYLWSTGGVLIGTSAAWTGGGGGSVTGNLCFVPDGVGVNWDLFAAATNNGLNIFTFPKTGNGTTDGGYAEYYYNKTAFETAFSGNASKIVIATSGAVYKDSISAENQVIASDGTIGPAGGGTFQGSTYTPDAYTVQTYDSASPGYEDFTKFTITANNAIGDVYYRSFDFEATAATSEFSDWTSAGKLENGTKTVDFTDIENDRFIQIAVLYDGIAWGDGHIISDITVYISSNIDWIYKSVYYLDNPSFDDPASPTIPRVFCKGRDIWKRALSTDINIDDYSVTTISPTNFIKTIADKCKIPYTATSIANITGFTNINWGDGFSDIKKGNNAFEFIMQKINPDGYQMYPKYDETEDENVLFVTLKPNVLEGEGAFSYKNYINIGNNRQNSDKMLQRYTVITDSQVVDAEEQLDQESISATGDTVFSWSGGAEYKRFEADLPDNIAGTVVVTPTGATLSVTSITGTVVVTLYGNKWKTTAPTYEGEAINFNNQINGKGNTTRTINPLMTSDTECKDVAESFITSFASPVQEAQGLRWPYINLLPEINDVYMLWRRFIFVDNLYFITKASHHWDRGTIPNENTMFNLDDSGRNFSEASAFVYDDEPTPMKYDVGFIYDMGISTPLSTDQEIDDATTIVRNTSVS